MNHNLIVRTISGAVYVAAILAGLLLGPISFGIVFLAFCFLCLVEFYQLINNGLSLDINTPIATFAGVFLYIAGYLMASGIVETPLIFVPWIAIFIYLSVREIYRSDIKNIHALAYTFFGQVYIALPFTLLTLLAFDHSYGLVAYGHEKVLALFVILWANDVMAYLFGSKFGKHRLLERISPKKSWEGFWAGLVSGIVAAVIFAFVWPNVLNIWQWIGFGLVVGVFGVWGDLFESLIKRCLGVKDSGRMMPGHGGIVDRMDSFLMAVPAAVLYLMFI